jgi:predicted nucleic acid-binding protein
VREPFVTLPAAIPIVLADSNVLYSRTLRDYLLYAAEQEIVNVNWSQTILDEVTEHLVANLSSFTDASAEALVTALAEAFPDALVEPTGTDYALLTGLVLPDEDDRHVIAAALAADARIICTSNVRHFPTVLTSQFGMVVATPDELFTQLIYNHMPQMVAAHRAAVNNFNHATDESTITALRRAGAPKTASLMAGALGIATA